MKKGGKKRKKLPLNVLPNPRHAAVSSQPGSRPGESSVRRGHCEQVPSARQIRLEN
jgi:hypothetical protein